MMEWYVAKVRPRNEQRVRKSLSRYGVEVYSPKIIVIRRGKECVEPLFPGYMFVRADTRMEVWPRIRWCRGLRYFLPVRWQPVPIGESVLEAIRSRVERWNAGGWAAAFEPGGRVIIGNGPLRTLNAVFQRYIPAKRRCEVLISLMESTHLVQLDVDHLQSKTLRQLA